MRISFFIANTCMPWGKCCYNSYQCCHNFVCKKGNFVHERCLSPNEKLNDDRIATWNDTMKHDCPPCYYKMY